jgi:hypothetical protein
MTLSCTLTLTGLDEAKLAAEIAERLMLQYVEAELEWFGQTVSQDAKEDHPYQDRTGELTRSIGFTVESWAMNRIQVNVFATATYAEAVEFGTSKSRPYPFLFPKFYLHLDELQFRIQAAVNKAIADAGQLFQ